MNKKLTNLLLIPLIVCLFGCSNQANSNENKELRIYNNIALNDKDFTLFRGLASVYYYGTYNSYDVVCYRLKDQPGLEASTEYTINNLLFYYPCCNIVTKIVNDNEIIPLDKAYRQQKLDGDSITTIHRLHTKYFKKYGSLWIDGFYDFTIL